MSEDNSKTENILRAAEGLGSSGISLFVGLGLWGLIAIIGVLGILFLLLNNGYIYNKENCIKLQQIEGIVYKINSCTNEVVELKHEE